MISAISVRQRLEPFQHRRVVGVLARQQPHHRLALDPRERRGGAQPLAYGEPAERRELPVLGGPPDVERLGRLAAEHRIELLGSPGMLPGELAASA